MKLINLLRSWLRRGRETEIEWAKISKIRNDKGEITMESDMIKII